jgi:hypothetical protein
MATQGKHDQDGNPEKQVAGAEIAEAVSRAQTAINRYDHTRKRLAARGVDPDGHPQLHDDLITLDAALQDAYAKLRKYVKNDVEDGWWNTKILAYDDGKPIVFGGREGETITIEDDDFDVEEASVSVDEVRFIEDYQGEIVEQREQQYERFEGWTEKRTIRPALMPVQAYRRAVRYLDEIRNELGFSPEADASTPRTEITEEMIEEATKRREEIAEEFKLNNGES